MGGSVVVGLVAGVGMLLGSGFGWLRLRQDIPASRFKRADRWAREVDLALFPELVEPLSDRLRRRAMATAAGAAVLVAPVWGIAAWYSTSRGVYAPQNPFTGPGLAVVVSAPATLPARTSTAAAQCCCSPSSARAWSSDGRRRS